VAAGRSDLLALAAGDLEEAMAGFLLIGDELGSAPSGPDAHGGSFDRLTAFFDGFNGGAALCATYEDDPPLVVFIPLAPEDDPQRGGDLPFEVAAVLLIEALEVFWEIVYPDLFGEPWEPVSAVIPYRPSTGEVPTCGGFSLGAEFYEYNAFYCPADDFVAWDDEILFPTLYADIGDFAIGLLLALQWGQAVQHRAGLDLEGSAAELQVDCLAGTWTAALTFEDNPTGLYLSAGDLEEGIAAFLTFSDGGATGPSAFERFEAFKNGFFDGTDACGM
jgi:predicted metalloprotease